MGGYITKPSAPLLEPAIHGDVDQVKTLVGYFIASCEGNDTSTSSNTTLQKAPSVPCLKLQSFVNQCDSEGNSALIGAAFKGNVDICQFLVQGCGADVLWKNHLGCSAFWIAAGYGHVNVVQYFIQFIQKSNQYDLKDVLMQTNHKGDTPILAATYKGYLSVVQTILESVAHDMDAKRSLLKMQNQSGDTALSVAIGACHEDLFHLLLNVEDECCHRDDNDRPLFHKTKKGLTPLHIASERNSASMVQSLLSRGAILSDMDGQGRTPLAVAAFCGCIDVATFILQRDKSTINSVDHQGCTPLWLAARTGNLKMVQLIVEAGADPMITNCNGLSAQDVAIKYQKHAVMEYFFHLEEVVIRQSLVK
jgi:cytohesin